MTQNDFLQRLEKEASVQSQLHEQRLLPAQLDIVTTIIGQYPWQTLSILAIGTSVILEVLAFLRVN